MLNKTISLVVLFALLSSQAFAICEQERSEFENWNSKCEELSAASQVSGVVGGFFAIATFGASMAPCAAAIAAAQNACRIRDEKKSNLTRCENWHAENARRIEVEAQVAIARERTLQQRISMINSDYENRKAEVTRDYAERLRRFVEDYAAEGWDINTPESQEHLRQIRVNFENERNARLDQLEQERQQDVHHA